MSNPAKTSPPLTVAPVYLAASAVHNLVGVLPAGSAYCIGSVLSPMVTGQLVHPQGSLARAAWPDVGHLRWGWQGGERARERGKGGRDGRFAQACTGSVACLPGEPVRLGPERRTVAARASSPGARRRATQPRGARLGKGDGQRAPRAVPAPLVAGRTTVVRLGGKRGGRVRRPRLGAPGQAAGAHRVAAVPERAAQRLGRGEAGRAPLEQVRAAPERAARGGRWRKNVTWRPAPHRNRPGQRGRPARHGPVRQPGAQRPEGRAAADPPLRREDRAGRVRRWRTLPCRAPPRTLREVGGGMPRPTRDLC